MITLNRKWVEICSRMKHSASATAQLTNAISWDTQMWFRTHSRSSRDGLAVVMANVCSLFGFWYVLIYNFCCVCLLCFCCLSTRFHLHVVTFHNDLVVVCLMSQSQHRKLIMWCLGKLILPPMCLRLPEADCWCRESIIECIQFCHVIWSSRRQ